MYKRILTLAGAMGIVLSAATAQAKLKFGHIDSQELITSLPEFKTIDQTLQSEAEKIETQYSIMIEDFQKQVDSYQKKADKMSDAEKTTKETELGQLQQRIQEFAQTAQQDIQQKRQTMMQPLLQKILNTIKEIGANEGFTYIFEKQAGLVLYEGAQSEDLAPKVKKKLGVK